MDTGIARHSILGQHHTGISVPDLEKALRFYRDLLGLEVTSRKSWARSEVMDTIVGLSHSSASGALLFTGSGFFELWEFDHPRPRTQEPGRPANDHGINHICFEVTDIESTYSHLMAAGVVFHCEPQDLGHAKITYARDPFGNILEFLQTIDATYPSVAREWPGGQFSDVVHD